MSLDSVRAVNFIELTQDFDLYASSENYGISPLYCNDSFHSQVGTCNPESAGSSYGWLYDFKPFYTAESQFYRGSGIVLPSKTPAIFELKNPNDNIIGVVH